MIALQEVLRPHNEENPLELLCDALVMHLAFAVTRPEGTLTRACGAIITLGSSLMMTFLLGALREDLSPTALFGQLLAVTATLLVIATWLLTR